MKNRDYWKRRFEILEQASVNRGQNYLQTLDREYRTAMARVESELSTWYQRFAGNNGITLAEAKQWLNKEQLAEFKWSVEDYIKYGQENALNKQWMKQLENASAKVHVSRLEALQLEIQQKIEVLYGNQLDGIDDLARKIYSEGYYHTAFEVQRGFNIGWDLTPLNQHQLDRVISKPWTLDKETFSDRIWNQKNALVAKVQTELTQSLLRGDSPDKAIKAISKQFNVSKHQAGRLVMTESAYFASESQKECFNALDVERFEIVATLDSHTSELCQSLDGHIEDMKNYEAGVTAPPFHPWCRTTTVPYFEDNFGQRAARGADGKTYYVPSDMKYGDWKKTFVQNGSKEGLSEVNPSDMMKGQSDSIQALRDSIFNKQEGILSDPQKQEFKAILAGMNEDELALYNNLSDNFGKNAYHAKGKAHYSPRQEMVKMDMNHNDWEKAVGNGREGAWKTKLHEELHQLDHILGKQMGSAGNKFTDISSPYGKRMIAAIEDDILGAISQATDWRNAQRIEGGMDAIFTSAKTLSRMSDDTKESLMYWLKEMYNTPKKRAQISAFTDAVGLATNNRISPYRQGFWGHDGAYNKQRGRSGATSEVWAEWGSIFLQGDDESKAVLKALMPNTWETYSDIFAEIIEYAASHKLKY